jgi:predicted RNase H-like nuclease (RuvC/YqgF family)
MHKNWCELKQGGMYCDCGETTVEKGRKYDSDVSDLRTRNAELQAKNKELADEVVELKEVIESWKKRYGN